MREEITKYHILPYSEGGWCVKKSGSKRLSGFASTQRGAEKLAARFMKKKVGMICIHDKSGRIIGYLGAI